ncbi:RNA-binding domain-containing protein [Coemansia reversa NRRL 1564]|uniref:RNA-binding domain-containing protein n=1 Tax=Coemansia reversa (strain ATCC 12441 / NRRL 1564) TaxID=763665 RepID=A0A2G5BC91_COERN|nr:RNA-binding domain-containing protein [Coemansia reversa NRRL 1564]|eukprot:PIA16639.1 RNA-binding domain-containing protein [Coemansia reversa NRRL 1564]
MKLTKKQRKALQFRGKLDKQEKEDRPVVSETTTTEISNDDGGERIEDDSVAANGSKNDLKVVGPGGVVRFIVFVGNLPFSSTADDLRQFMKKANPVSVRLITNKETGKSRGFAFVEFATSADMRCALMFHHHKLKDKKINVDLTAGGGGNSENRKNKIKRRRDELEQERSSGGISKRRKHNNTAAVAKGNGTGDNTADTPAEETLHVDAEPEGSTNASKKPNRRKRGRGSHK